MAERSVTVAERRHRLARRHRLTAGERVDDVARIADDLVCLHSSDPVTVYLSAAARMSTPSIDAVASALHEERSIVRHHAMRRTLWVMTPEVARAAHAASTRRVAAGERKRMLEAFEDNGIADDVERWLEDAARLTLAALRERGEATTKELGEDVPALRAPVVLAPGKAYGTTVSAHTRVLRLLGYEGRIVRTTPVGTWVSSQYRWAPMEHWLPGGLGDLGEDEACKDLVARWLWTFGPGTTDDIRRWTGLPVGSVRRAIDAIGAVEVDLDGGAAGWLAPDDVDPEPAAEPWVALLPGLDPTTMGWKARDWYLSDGDVPMLVDRNGNAGPTVWVDGEIVGAWTQRADGTIAFQLTKDLGRERCAAIEAAAGALEDLVGDARFSPRFPAPLQKQLSG